MSIGTSGALLRLRWIERFVVAAPEAGGTTLPNDGVCTIAASDPDAQTSMMVIRVWTPLVEDLDPTEATGT